VPERDGAFCATATDEPRDNQLRTASMDRAWSMTEIVEQMDSGALIPATQPN